MVWWRRASAGGGRNCIYGGGCAVVLATFVIRFPTSQLSRRLNIAQLSTGDQQAVKFTSIPNTYPTLLSTEEARTARSGAVASATMDYPIFPLKADQHRRPKGNDRNEGDE